MFYIYPSRLGPCGAMGWSVVCDSGISRSYSLVFFINLLLSNVCADNSWLNMGKLGQTSSP